MTKRQVNTFLRDKRTKIAILMIIVFIAGYRSRPARESQVGNSSQTSAAATIWTCSMDPQVRQDEPGACPICGMDLIPLESSNVLERQIEFSEAAKKLMQIETSVVERKFVTSQIRMVGKIAYDETRVKYITAWVPGRIERLFADYTGMTVNKGDHLVEMYSPELFSAQAELLQAVKSAKSMKKTSSEYVSQSIHSTLNATREKLKLLGLDADQIKKIEQSEEPVQNLTINAPIGGIVIHKNATEGMYVETGTQIYTIADLSQLWVMLDAYESDMMWVRYGQKVEFTTDAYPGETFGGRLSFIDPMLNEKTRTFKLRVNIANPGGKLKPEMFVRAVLSPVLASGGKAIDADLAGKWICPMHTEIVEDVPGECSICQMALVTPESLGYVSPANDEAPLVIPASAPLVTGKRAVVYVQLPGTEQPTYEGREVTLGPRAGEYYLVESGLAEGEVVVTKGNFKIDSAMQIQAKPSMMNPAGIQMQPMHDHGEQTVCPVMGGAINKDIFVEYKGKKVYFCCPGCEDIFLKDPEKYMDKLPQFGE
ncbi:MAG: efflux RND transporter periplasmic adaptor subunit [Planctomycetes bacterium]|nr:efflux RND transporter periplasmic adaptor subunit [Planctomycetota bacterium]